MCPTLVACEAERVPSWQGSLPDPAVTCSQRQLCLVLAPCSGCGMSILALLCPGWHFLEPSRPSPTLATAGRWSDTLVAGRARVSTTVATDPLPAAAARVLRSRCRKGHVFVHYTHFCAASIAIARLQFPAWRAALLAGSGAPALPLFIFHSPGGLESRYTPSFRRLPRQTGLTGDVLGCWRG